MTETDKSDDAKVSAINRLNDLEKDIEQFKRFKNEISNIYNNAKDNKDLKGKLVNFFKKITQKEQKKYRHFMTSFKSGDTEGIEFPNNFLEMWAKLSKKKREIKKNQAEIDKLKEDIAEESSNTNPDTVELSKIEVKEDTEKIQAKKKEIMEITAEVNKEDQEIKKRLDQTQTLVKKDMQTLKKERQRNIPSAQN